ncbi:RluA family pseudouridine synthase [Candidatus Microgenomates bacterium]|nr:MAG: RluA family pseudouridine synthase [Candidatus Microgenomates bacterium]
MATNPFQTTFPTISILFEDEYLLVINKPAGLVVNRAQTVKTATIQDWVEQKLKIQSTESKTEADDFYNRSGIVHRIDKETSGCLIIAKTAEVFYELQKIFKEHEVKKEYMALVHGKLLPASGEITAPIGRLPWNRERFGVVPEGKEAHTAYQVKSYYQDDKGVNYTFVELLPTTGRTHQLRVHLAYLGFPIVGDYLYAGRKRKDRDRIWCPRVFLHAQKIAFAHPKNHVMVTVEAPFVTELQQALSVLHQSS